MEISAQRCFRDERFRDVISASAEVNKLFHGDYCLISGCPVHDNLSLEDGELDKLFREDSSLGGDDGRRFLVLRTNRSMLRTGGPRPFLALPRHGWWE